MVGHACQARGGRRLNKYQSHPADPQSYAPFCASRCRSIFAQKGAPLYGPLMRGVRLKEISYCDDRMPEFDNEGAEKCGF